MDAQRAEKKNSEKYKNDRHYDSRDGNRRVEGNVLSPRQKVC